jgi:hypothetical protein
MGDVIMSKMTRYELALKSKSLGKGNGAVLYFDQKSKTYGVEIAEQGIAVFK